MWVINGYSFKSQAQHLIIEGFFGQKKNYRRFLGLLDMTICVDI